MYSHEDAPGNLEELLEELWKDSPEELEEGGPEPLDERDDMESILDEMLQARNPEDWPTQ